MTCPRPGCGQPTYPDTESVIETYGMRVRMVCRAGHSAWLTLSTTPLHVDRPIVRRHQPPVACKCGCGLTIEDGRNALYRIGCRMRLERERDHNAARRPRGERTMTRGGA